MQDSGMKRQLVAMSLMLSSLFSGLVSAVTLSPNDVAAHMADPANVAVILHANSLFEANEFTELDAYLETLTPLLKEETLTVLARSAQNFSNMTPEREKFLVTISHQQPTYLVKSQATAIG